MCLYFWYVDVIPTASAVKFYKSLLDPVWNRMLYS